MRGSELPSKGMDPQTERPKKMNTEHLIADRQGGIGVCGWILVSLSFLLVLITFPISIWACIKVVREYERAVVFRLGHILSKKAKGPGMILVLPCTDTFIKVDLRTVACKIPPQEILTRDAVTAQVDGVVHYRIHSAVSAVANVTDVHSATLLLAQTALRNVLGTQSLAQVLAGREEIAHSIQGTPRGFPSASTVLFLVCCLSPRLPSTVPRSSGESKWLVWRSETSGSPWPCRGQWQLKQRLLKRKKLRLWQLKEK
ncbi:stomatin-like protein 3 isoform X2 [Molothrus aeneus]|uniref:stomatin-like protein 3 isoform X2 n=1 Tax=Molothrus aeneus TaxID=84833 RepID=UPI003458E99D